jgi:hypothetical protein
LIDAKIECTDRMLTNIFSQDEESQKLKILPKFNDLWHTFDEAVSDATQKY